MRFSLAFRYAHTEARLAELSQRVNGLHEADRKLEVAVSALDRRMDEGFTLISSKIEARSITPWPVLIGICTLLMGGFTTVGYLARQPLSDAIELNRIQLIRNADQRILEDRRLWDRLSEQDRALARLEGRLLGRTQ